MVQEVLCLASSITVYDQWSWSFNRFVNHCSIALWTHTFNFPCPCVTFESIHVSVSASHREEIYLLYVTAPNHTHTSQFPVFLYPIVVFKPPMLSQFWHPGSPSIQMSSPTASDEPNVMLNPLHCFCFTNVETVTSWCFTTVHVIVL